MAYSRHFPAINWLNSYSLYTDMLKDWYDKNLADDWVELRRRMMQLLQSEAELNEIVKLVGMDALGARERLVLECARSIREDFLHQNAFDEVDTYTSPRKQLFMMRLIMGYYDSALLALEQQGELNEILKLGIRDEIARFKYTPEQDIDSQYEKIKAELLGIAAKKEA